MEAGCVPLPDADDFVSVVDVAVPPAIVFDPVDVCAPLAGVVCGVGVDKLALYRNPTTLVATTVASCAFLQSSGVNPASIVLVFTPVGSAGGGNLVVRLGILVMKGHAKRKIKEDPRGSNCINRAMNLV
jgi:hypothetical protein